jgi:ribosomal protein L14E/L6E/L27E
MRGGLMTGYLAYSLAGHDKGEIYLIIKEENEYVYVADGRARTVLSPKKKNRKHIQVIKKVDPRTDISSVTDEEIKHLINSYCKGIKEVK